MSLAYDADQVGSLLRAPEMPNARVPRAQGLRAVTTKEARLEPEDDGR
jgi:hypothetical protein